MAKDVKKRRRRRRRRSRGGTLLLTALCALLAAAAILAAMTIFFKISAVEVLGDTRYAPAELIEASGVTVGKNMFFFNKFTSISRMFERFPYLREITIRRRLPDVIEITVSDCVPVAALADGGQVYLVDGTGKLLEHTALKPDGLVLVEGIGLDKPELGQKAIFLQPEKEKPLFLLLNTLTEDGIIQEVTSVDMTEAYQIGFTYLDRFTVRIGTTEDLNKKLRYLHAIVEDRLTPNQRGVIDLSDVEAAWFRSE